MDQKYISARSANGRWAGQTHRGERKSIQKNKKIKWSNFFQEPPPTPPLPPPPTVPRGFPFSLNRFRKWKKRVIFWFIYFFISLFSTIIVRCPWGRQRPCFSWRREEATCSRLSEEPAGLVGKFSPRNVWKAPARRGAGRPSRAFCSPPDVNKAFLVLGSEPTCR